MTAPATTQVEVPDIGDFTDVPIIELHVAVGDVIAVDDPLATLESDKATMDVPSSHAGRVTEVLVAVGDTVSQGTPVLRLDAADGEPTQDGPTESDAPVPKDAPAAADAEVTAQEPATEKASQRGGGPVQRPSTARRTVPGSPSTPGPSVRKLAREFEVDLDQVAGHRAKGRITKSDLLAYVAGPGEAPAAAPAAPSGGSGIPESRRRTSRSSVRSRRSRCRGSRRSRGRSCTARG